MDKVYIIEGWFGDNEWIEAVYADELEAENRAAALWLDRKTDKFAEDYYIQGLCKFAVVEHEVL